MSGWENVPPDEGAPTTPRKRQDAAPVAEQASMPADVILVEDGVIAQMIDTYWPYAWLTMLTIVCMIGVWAAIGKLPNHPSWWP